MILLTPNFGVIFWQTITFLIVLWVLARFAWGPIIEIVEAREEALAHAASQIAHARSLVQQVEGDRIRLLEEASLEQKRIINDALITKKQIINQTHQEALMIREQLLTETKIELDKSKQRALDSLKDSLGLLAIQIAEKLLYKKLSQDHEQLELIDHLVASENQSSAVLQ